MVLRDILKKKVEELRENEIEEPKLKARMIMANVLKKPKEYIYTHDEMEIKKEEQDKFEKGIDKLKQGFPIQYITNEQMFWNLPFYVDENVLIPQPDTEILVEQAIQIIKKKGYQTILDLCTGSGAIGITIASQIEKIKVYATDISHKAIQIAKLNAEKNKVHTKMQFIECNLFKALDSLTFDMIVSNPPYIKKQIISTLSKQVQQEPILALDGGEDGLFFYQAIIKEAPKYLKSGGYLCLEIGYDQKQEVEQLLADTKEFEMIETKKDLAGLDRVMIAKKVK